MHLRRSAALVASAAALALAGTAGAPVAAAETPSPAGDLPSGLYGKADPQYDGVYRQSLALLAQDAVDVVPAKRAVDWLAQQQCDGGAYAAYRADSTEACGAGGAEDTPDTNATAMAVQALAALGGHGERVKTSVAWLKSAQNKDGGWGYNPGSPSDANSTALVVGALAATGEKPAEVLSKTGSRSPQQALADLQLGCDAKAAERGAYAYQPGEEGELVANDAATAAAALAAAGHGMATVEQSPNDADPGRARVPAPECEGEGYAAGDAAQAAAAYLSGKLADNDHHLVSAMPGADEQPDHGTTALAALALAAGGHHKAAEGPLGWLEKNLDSWESADQPAALGQLVLAVHTAGSDPTDFGGTDLVAQLNATGPEPAEQQPADEADGDDSGGTSPLLWILGAGLVAGIGFGLLMSLRNKKAATPKTDGDGSAADGGKDA